MVIELVVKKKKRQTCFAESEYVLCHLITDSDLLSDFQLQYKDRFLLCSLQQSFDVGTDSILQ